MLAYDCFLHTLKPKIVHCHHGDNSNCNHFLREKSVTDNIALPTTNLAGVANMNYVNSSTNLFMTQLWHSTLLAPPEFPALTAEVS